MAEHPIPLHALRHFEAAARLGSFKAAANELHVTQGAVSQQIRELEVFLEVRLFERMARKVILTLEGKRLSQVATQAISDLGRAVREIRGRSGHRTLRVEVGPFFSAHWLAPKLGNFVKLHPEIDIHLIHAFTKRLPDTEVDVCLRWGDGKWPWFSVEKLIDVYLQPICMSGTKASLKTKLENPKTLDLLHAQTRNEWREWLGAAGFDEGLAKRGTMFDEPNVAYEAVISGLGFGIGYLPVIDDDLSKGRVVTAHPTRVKASNSYFLLRSSSAATSKSADVFCKWILDQSSSLRD